MFRHCILIVGIILSIALNGCGMLPTNTVKVTVVNNSSQHVDSFAVSVGVFDESILDHQPVDSKHMWNLAPGDEVELNWNLSGTTTSDGTFLYEARIGQERTLKAKDGYVSNGGAQFKEVLVEIEDRGLKTDVVRY